MGTEAFRSSGQDDTDRSKQVGASQAAARSLCRDGPVACAAYLPLNREVRFHGKRKTTVELPIFSGYVFLRGSLDEAYTADRTKRVVNIIRVADQEQLGWELTNLRLALSKNSNVQPYPFLQSGVRVEVRSGPMRGVQGIVENRIGVNRLVLQVKMLGRAVSVEIDPGLLEIVN